MPVDMKTHDGIRGAGVAEPMRALAMAVTRDGPGKRSRSWPRRSRKIPSLCPASAMEAKHLRFIAAFSILSRVSRARDAHLRDTGINPRSHEKWAQL